MSVREVTMYRVVCDAPDCKSSPQDDAEFFAWADAGSAIADTEDHDGWYVGDFGHFCEYHLPRCPDCGSEAHRDYWLNDDGRCDDCTESPAEEVAHA